MSDLPGHGRQYRQRKFRPVLSKQPRVRQGTFVEPGFNELDRPVLGEETQRERVDAMLRSRRLRSVPWEYRDKRVSWLARVWEWINRG